MMHIAQTIEVDLLKINYLSPAGSHDTGQNILIDSQQLAKVSIFKCLGIHNQRNEEINTGMSGVCISYGRLKRRAWYIKYLTLKIKCAVNQANVLSTLLYEAEASSKIQLVHDT